MDHEFLKRFETSLQMTLLKMATSMDMLAGTLLASEDIDDRWRILAPEYMADAVKEISQYPTVSLAWAAYLGMAVAHEWDKSWDKNCNAGYASYYGHRGFDDMDEHIVQNILKIDLQSDDATKIENVIRVCAEDALSQIRHSGIESQSPTAFHTFARACKTLYRIGAAIELYRLGYKYEKINLN